MNSSRIIKSLLILVVTLLISVSQSAWGGFQEGVDAYKRKDYATAFKEFKPLAEKGHARAQNSLGFMYVKGRGVPRDYMLAVKWARKSAEQGVSQSQFLLGAMYRRGLGVPKDLVSAYMWLNLSSINGKLFTEKRRRVMENLMTPSQIEKAQSLTREWLEKHRKK